MEEIKNDGGSGHPGERTNPRLNWLNFFAADVSDGVGPFLSAYLIGVGNWSEASIGTVLLTLNLATVVAQTPAGWLIDRTRFKRFITAGTALWVAGCVLVPAFTFDSTSVLLAAAGLGLAVAFIPPAISAMTLGIVGPQRLAKQTGSNQAFNHAGNVFAALAILVGCYFAPWGFSPIIAILACTAAVIALSIPEKSIDHDVARGGLAEVEEKGKADGRAWKAVFLNRPLLVFMVCVGLFHLSNAAMLPLAGQKLTLGDAVQVEEQIDQDRSARDELPEGKNGEEDPSKKRAMLYLALCVTIAQVVMIGVSIFIGMRADRWGRKQFLLIGFASLPLRGLLFSQVSNPYLVMSGQILDGIGAGVYGVIVILVVADLTRGTGVFNFASGVVITVQGSGASFGSWLGEWWAGAYGYGSAYSLLTALGVIALLVLAVFMPETHPDKVKKSRKQANAGEENA